jgi:hypothetical protein
MSNVAPTVDDFATLYPQFTSDEYAAQVDAQLNMSARLLSVDAWQDFWSDAVMLDCAHCLSVGLQAATGGPTGGFQMAVGPISSVSVAGTSTSFNTISVDSKLKSEVWYNKTVYGQAFLRLRNVCIAPGVVDRGPDPRPNRPPM